MTIEITETAGIPDDYEEDPSPIISGDPVSEWFNPEYPHSTPEHPYGYFPKSATNPEPDFSRPRKRRPHGHHNISGGSATSTRSDNAARTAASMLARINNLFGLAFQAMGMPQSMETMKRANDTFEEMAYEALINDPALARKILSAGASTAKAQLAMAYVMLGGSIAPSVVTEIREKREAKELEENEQYPS